MAYDNIKSLKNQDFTHTLSLSLSLEDTLLEKHRVRGVGWGGGGVIFHAAKPKAAIMPVPFGLAVELGHVVG